MTSIKRSMCDKHIHISSHFTERTSVAALLSSVLPSIATVTVSKNIFVSHVHEDDGLLPKLKTLLERQDVDIRDASINSSKPNDATSEDYIKSKILAPRINWASVLVVLITHDTARSPWVNWEIEYAAKQGKPIVGIFAQGAMDADVPAALLQNGDDLVGWNSGNIADAILHPGRYWENPEGDVRDPIWPIQRYRC